MHTHRDEELGLLVARVGHRDLLGHFRELGEPLHIARIGMKPEQETGEGVQVEALHGEGSTSVRLATLKEVENELQRRIDSMVTNTGEAPRARGAFKTFLTTWVVPKIRTCEDALSPERMTGPDRGRLSAGVGTKYDTDKLRLDLWPLRAYLSIGAVITLGAKKYAPRNWQKLESFDDRFYAALMRHLTSWRLGEKHDPETGLPHLAHAGCNLVFLLSKELGFDP